MAGPPRTRARSPFDHVHDDGHNVYSPLANLVRKASLNHSSSAGGVPTYASLALNQSAGQASDTRPANMRSVSDQPPRSTHTHAHGKKAVPPSLVLEQQRHSQSHQRHQRAQPSSPLLHTRFRASVATSIGSSSDLDQRDSQEVEYPFHHHNQQHQPSSGSGSDSNYTPSPGMHRPFAYVVDDTHASGGSGGVVPSPTSQYSAGPPSPNQPFQFDTRTSVAPSEDIRPPFQYDPRASSITASTDAPFHYDDSGSGSKLNLASTSSHARASTASAYNPRGTWRSSAAPEPDPFSFRDYESPRVEPPTVVVHSPMSTIQDLGDEDVEGDRFFLADTQPVSGERQEPQGELDADADLGSTSYHDAYEYVYGAIEADDQDQEEPPTSAMEQHFFAPEPTGAILPAAVASASGGRVASVVTGGGRYNYSRPLRSAVGGSVSGAQVSASSAPSGISSGAGSAAYSQDESAASNQTGSSVAGGGRSPLRKATGPLIFQSPDEGQEQRASSVNGQNGTRNRSPSSAYTGQSPNSQRASPSLDPQYAHQPTNPQYASQSPSSQHTRGQSPNSQLSDGQSSNLQRPPSLYSQYSFYSLPGSTPPESPLPTQDGRSGQPRKPPGSQLNPNTQQNPTPPTSSKYPKPPSAAQQYLTRGIAAHEQNDLRESARCFERSATAEGGCGVGMLMWGLSLRHGWGCRKDERTGFRWLRRAAEAAVTDLESARSGEEAKAVRNELVLAIYEVGQCFFHGWGVGQDKTMAVSYFQVAARLGDCDAQQELAFCYLNGKGCKKDMKEAARWYRAAAEQGASTVGLAWIYKSKYT